MRKLIAIAILGFAALGLGAGPASAGWLLSHCCCHKCCMTLCAKQYNAFSPYCLDSFNGCFPLQGGAGNGGCYLGCPTGFNAHAGVACLGELPAPGAAGGATVFNGQFPQPAREPIGSGPVTVPNGSGAVLVPGGPSRGWAPWTTGPANPNGVPSYYPAANGFGQTNIPGR